MQPEPSVSYLVLNLRYISGVTAWWASNPNQHIAEGKECGTRGREGVEGGVQHKGDEADIEAIAANVSVCAVSERAEVRDIQIQIPALFGFLLWIIGPLDIDLQPNAVSGDFVGHYFVFLRDQQQRLQALHGSDPASILLP